MARRPRDSAAGAFHITAHSVWSAELFRDDVDRYRFVQELARTVARQRWVCLEVCLLTTHYHLIVDVENETLPAGMQDLNFRYATWFNARHRLRGHVFAGRYGAQRIETDAQLLTTFRYVARNPFDAGIVEEPATWRWGSYAAIARAAEWFSFVDASRVIDCFGRPRQLAVARLIQFVETPW